MFVMPSVAEGEVSAFREHLGASLRVVESSGCKVGRIMKYSISGDVYYRHEGQLGMKIEARDCMCFEGSWF